MKAAVVPSPGKEWEITEVPRPSPGPCEVLVRVHACGLCHNDVLIGRGAFPFLGDGPIITGHEAVGEIVEVGAGVTTRGVGDRVGVPWVQASCGRCEHCSRDTSLTGLTAMACAAPRATGVTVQGGHAEYIVAAADGTALLPESLSYTAAAPILCAGYTAWSALVDARPQPLDRVAVVGIGGIGHLALQYARTCGFETIAVTRSPDKAELASVLGADEVVSDGAGLRAVGGADVIVAATPDHRQSSDALQGLNARGRFVLVGIDPEGTFTLGARSPLWARGQQIIGSTQAGPERLAEALDMAASGRVSAMVETFSKERVAEAVNRMVEGRTRFRAVITY
ncbi:alcohol dehydrogenase catalytic domain-containing protein [Nocardiopsis sp. FIRDI 009]|uniref:alcohol dehydrogenase catalytic domain-containing protein n=1 Tax=Nocardiopsis sp. FIRDI 009 TaxID=714197 RepID=UPI000E265A93|nr:alcohol dehydrogenase catalytic domain-containing protein [Nocardiopsis sp. FIRDI 009]